MKYSKYLLLAALATLFASACEKDEDVSIEKSFDMFYFDNTQFASDEGKVALQFSTNRLVYEEGDKVRVNGKEFTLSKTGSGESTKWFAKGPDAVTGSKFYCAYADGVVDGTLSGTGSTVTFNIGGRLSSATNKVLLGGVSDSNVLTLKPACAIIKLNANDSYSNVKVAFESTKVMKTGTMTISESGVTLLPTSYLTGVTEGGGTTGGGADFLKMEYNSAEGYWYVAVPVSTTVTTTLYFYWELGGTPTGWKTSGRVELNKGFVYSVGSSRQTPFNTDGTSKCQFKVRDGRGGYVQFSPGNLQAKNTASGNIWQFASTQLEYLGSEGASAIESEVVGKTWDLFGFGTSNWNSGAAEHDAYSYLNTPANYIQQSLTGSYVNADWGVYNGSSIRYKGSASGTTWRTLTSDEWSHLINRTDKVALATVNGIKGLLLLPDVASNGEDEWEMPTGISLNYSKSSYSNNSISGSTWNTLEAAGVIFLPVTGYRNRTNWAGSEEGHYWSSTYDNSSSDPEENEYYAYCMRFNGSAINVISSDKSISQGRAVRLVHPMF